jgi:N-dimethylarginine dimethylaminohydrolase
MPSFGSSSECGKLRSVLLHRPGPEIETVQNANQVLWLDLLDPERAREQHDTLVEICRSHGVVINYVEDTQRAKPNLYFMRDTFAMTPAGAILAAPASTVRAGEETIAARTLAQLEIPIVLSVNGGGTFEGADLMIVHEDLAFVAQGSRTNVIGASQVETLLKGLGFGEVVRIPLNDGCMHLDCALSIVDRDLAMVYPKRVSRTVWQPLKRHGFRVIEVPTEEAEVGMSINMVALEPGLVVMPANNPSTRTLLEAYGVTCVEVDISELMKGEGAVHCMIGVLQRDAA